MSVRRGGDSKTTHIGGFYTILAAVVVTLGAIYAAVLQKSASTTSSSQGVNTVAVSAESSGHLPIVPKKEQRQSIDTVAVSAGNPGDIETAFEEIRREHGVKELDVADNELKLSLAPRGTYSFANPTSLFLLDTPIIDRKSTSDDFEIHKLENGKAELVGFVSPDVADHLRRDDNSAKMSFTLYNKAWSRASNIVSVPLDHSRIKTIGRTIPVDENNNVKALDLTAK